MLPSRPTLRHRRSPSRTRQLIPRAQPHLREITQPHQSWNGRIRKPKKRRNSWTQRKNSELGTATSTQHKIYSGPIHHLAPRSFPAVRLTQSLPQLTGQAYARSNQPAQAMLPQGVLERLENNDHTHLSPSPQTSCSTQAFPGLQKPHHIAGYPI